VSIVVPIFVVAMPPSSVFATTVPAVILAIIPLRSVVTISPNANLGDKSGWACGTIIQIVSKDRLQEEQR
jgi:hypothetical protein